MEDGFIPPHGGYEKLLSYRKAEIVFDLTVRFCAKFIDRKDRTADQMVQAARSGKQNIAEGSIASGTSKDTELELLNVSRASLEELLRDYHDHIRSRNEVAWSKNSAQARYVRRLGCDANESFESYRTFIETRPSIVVANIAICLIHQANYLLERQIRQLEREFLKEGGIRERMTQARLRARSKLQRERRNQ